MNVVITLSQEQAGDLKKLLGVLSGYSVMRERTFSLLYRALKDVEVSNIRLPYLDITV